MTFRAVYIIMQNKRWENGKSYHKYYYTVKDISEITGRAIGTIRNDMSKKKLIMDDLRNILKYIANYTNTEYEDITIKG